MGNALHVLHLEDDLRDAELVRETLKAKGIPAEVELVQTEAEFVAAIEEGKLDLILADYVLASFDGLSALRLAQARSPEIPFLFVSGVMGEDLAVEAMKAGAHDYVMKGNLKRLVPAIERELRQAQVRRIIYRGGTRTWAGGAINAGAASHFSLPQSTERTVS